MDKFVYRVEENESLAAVADKFSMPLAALIADNQLKSKEAYAGMRLLICKRQGQMYIVKPFDRLSKIAKDFNVDESRIREENSLSAQAEVFLGQRIFIPQ